MSARVSVIALRGFCADAQVGHPANWPRSDYNTQRKLRPPVVLPVWMTLLAHQHRYGGHNTQLRNALAAAYGLFADPYEGGHLPQSLEDFV